MASLAATILVLAAQAANATQPAPPGGQQVPQGQDAPAPPGAPPSPVPPIEQPLPAPDAETGIPPVNEPAATAPREPPSNRQTLAEGDSGEEVFEAQVLLSRAGFSPGTIDGNFGRLSVKAATGFQEARGLQTTGRIDAETWAALGSGAPVLIDVPVDEMGQTYADVPDEPAAQAKLSAMSYESFEEAVAERFHTTPRALAELNQGKEIRPGETLKVPNVSAAAAAAPGAAIGGPETTRSTRAGSRWMATLDSLSVSPDQPRAARLVIDKSEKLVRALDASGRLIAQFPATIGSSETPSPEGSLTIRAIAHNPAYNYDPKVLNREGTEKFKLPPGPNNLVGVVWIDLSKQRYGIHGTPEPAQIGKNASHGCVRLTNWDAARLAQMVERGTAVEFQS